MEFDEKIHETKELSLLARSISAESLKEKNYGEKAVAYVMRRIAIRHKNVQLGTEALKI